MAKTVVVLTVALLGVASFAYAGFVQNPGGGVDLETMAEAGTALTLPDIQSASAPAVIATSTASVGVAPVVASATSTATNSNSFSSGLITAEGEASVGFFVTTIEPDAYALGTALSEFDLFFSVSETAIAKVTGQVTSSFGIVVDPSSYAQVELYDEASPIPRIFDVVSTGGTTNFANFYVLDPGIN